MKKNETWQVIQKYNLRKGILRQLQGFVEEWTALHKKHGQFQIQRFWFCAAGLVVLKSSPSEHVYILRQVVSQAQSSAGLTRTSITISSTCYRCRGQRLWKYISGHTRELQNHNCNLKNYVQKLIKNSSNQAQPWHAPKMKAVLRDVKAATNHACGWKSNSGLWKQNEIFCTYITMKQQMCNHTRKRDVSSECEISESCSPKTNPHSWKAHTCGIALATLHPVTFELFWTVILDFVQFLSACFYLKYFENKTLLLINTKFVV